MEVNLDEPAIRLFALFIEDLMSVPFHVSQKWKNVSVNNFKKCKNMNFAILCSEEGVTSLAVLYCVLLLGCGLVGWNKLTYNTLA